jgi:hypothetical protein
VDRLPSTFRAATPSGRRRRSASRCSRRDAAGAWTCRCPRARSRKRARACPR